MSISNDLFRKSAIIALSIVTAIGMAGAVFATAPTAHGQSLSSSQIDSIISLLESFGADQNTIDNVQTSLEGGTPSGTTGSTGTPDCNFTRSLSEGMSGDDVMCLQEYLNSAGYTVSASGPGSPGNETDYFGSRTTQAAIAWQNANASDVLQPVGLSSGTGYWGQSSISHYNNIAADSTDDSDDSTDDSDDSQSTSGLQGGEGYLDAEDLSLSSYDIDLGDTEVVYETEFEANDSDVAINRVDFLFEDRPWLYFDEVRLLIDGQEVAVLGDSSGDYDEIDDNYRARFSSLNEVVAEDDTVEVELEVVVKDSMQGTRDGDTVDVTMDENAVRFVDGAGINDYAPDSDAFTDVDITFNDTFEEGDIDVSLGNNSPEDETFLLDEDSDTQDVEVLEFDVEAEESDIIVNDVHATFGIDNDFTTTTLGQLIDRTRLYANGSLIDTQSVATTSTTSVDVVFDDLDYEIDEDDTVSFTLEVDFNDVDEVGDFPAEFEAFVTEVDAETGDFSEATQTNLSIGQDEFHSLVVEGLVAQVVDITEESSGENSDVGEYTFVFDVTAYGDTFYIDEDTATSVVVSVSPDDATTSTTSTVLTSDATLTSNDNFRVNKDQTREFTVEGFISNLGQDDGGQAYRMTVESLEYGTSDSAPFGTILTLGGSDYRSGSVFLQAPSN